jgi:hypothetical protein
MKIGGRYRRAYVALIISITVNCVVGVIAAVAYSRPPQSHSRLARVLDALAAPPNAVAEMLAPSGHGAAHFLGVSVLAFMLSVVSYGGIAWLVLLIVPKFRVLIRRQSSSATDAGPTL